jgi:hypothetical protein
MVKRERLWGVFAYCLLVAALYLLVCSKSSPLYPINDWTDANAFLSSGKGMLAGRVMYRDIYEHKGPLLYALHALCVLAGGGFGGVFVLEVLCAALFLLAAYRLLRLYGAARTALFALPVIAALVYASFSFQQGDSAEELCLPLLAWPLYWLLAWRRQRAPGRMDARTLLLGGVMFSCVFWIKFTMVGLFGVWIAGLFAWHAARGAWRAAWGCAGWFAAGALLATLPWVAYFGLYGAVGDWLKTYLYDNLFLYSGGAGGLAEHAKAVARAVWDWVSLNVGYTLPLLAGLCAFALAGGRRSGVVQDGVSCFEKWMLWLMAAATGLGVFIGGKAYVYYGLILAAFMPFAALWLCLLAERLPRQPRPLGAAALAGLTIVSAALCVFTTPNRGDLLAPRAQTMQYRFAAIINRTPNATLLNYGFMDAGFYTAAGIVPSVKYFHQTNVPLPEMRSEQARYVAEGITDYVVSRAALPADMAARYSLVAMTDAPESFWYRQVFLYRRKDVAP